MRIGELLAGQYKLKPRELQHALADQQRARQRLCSLLIARGVLDFDDAARALAEQQGVASMLSSQLARRDASLVELLPSELAQTHCALPIGYTRRGELIVCARDPSAKLRALLSEAIAATVVMAVAPASPLEQLVARRDGDAALAMSARKSPPRRRARWREITSRTAPLLDALAHATTRDAANTIAADYMATRWTAGIVFSIRGKDALAIRGHGQALPLVATMTVPLHVPSIVQRAAQLRRISFYAAASPIENAVLRWLGNPSSVAAAPVVVGGNVVAVLVVGDSVHGADDARQATEDLHELAVGLGAARARVAHR